MSAIDLSSPNSTSTRAMPRNPSIVPSTGTDTSAGVAQIATSNQTLNAFIGGPRPSWMAISQHPTSPITAPSELVGPSSITSRKRARPPQPATAPSNNAPQQDDHGHRRVSNPWEKGAPTLSVGTETFRPQTVLPSPAPTDEPSPVVSNQIDSPGQMAYRQVDGAVSTQVTSQRGPQNGEGTTSAATGMNPALGHGGSAVQHALNNTSSMANTIPAGNMEPSIPNPINGKSTTYRPIQSLQSPPQEPNQGLGSIPADDWQPRFAAIPNSTEHGAKRVRLSQPHLMLQWHSALKTQASHLKRKDDLNSVRFNILLTACGKQDLFFMAVHQVLCLWSLERSTVYKTFHPAVPPKVIDSACEILQTILRKNEGLCSKQLQWLSRFPAPISELISTNDSYQSALHDTALFLTSLSQYYHILLTGVHKRHFPFLASETIFSLACPSGDLQFMLFTVSRRCIGVADGSIANELSSLFNREQKFEREAFASDAGQEEVQRSRTDFAVRYAHLVRQARRHPSQSQQRKSSLNPEIARRQLNLFNPAAPLSTPTTPSVPMALPSTNLPNPQRRVTAPGPVNQSWSVQSNTPPVPTSQVQPTHSHGPNASISPNPQAASQPMRQPGLYSYLAPTSTSQVAPQPAASDPTRARPQPQGRTQSLPQQGFMPSPVAQPPLDGQTLPPVQHQAQPTAGGYGGQDGTPHVVPALRGLQAPQHFSRPSPTQTTFNPQVPSSNLTWPSNLVPVMQPDGQVVMVAPLPSQAVPSPILTQMPSQLASQLPPQAQRRTPSDRGRNSLTPAYTIPPNEYAMSPYDATSVEIGLHQVGLRSPRRAPRDPPVMRHYQFVGRFATEPMEIQPRMGLRTLSFTVSPTEASNISRKIDCSGMPFSKYHDGSLRYRLRLCMRPEHETVVKKTDWAVSPNHWPTHIMFEFNGQSVDLRRKQHFHKDLPLELSTLVVPGQNIVRISFPPVSQNFKPKHKYLVAVEVVETRSHSTLRKMIETNQRIPPNRTKEKVKRRLRPNNSDDIIVEDQTLSVSIADPFSSSMFDVPVRGVDCQHLECFDLETWLQTRPSKPKQPGGEALSGGEPSMVDVWKCPICNLDARPSSLLVDEFFVQVRKALLSDRNNMAKSITIDGQGDWAPVHEVAGEEDENSPEPSRPWMDERRGSKAAAATQEVIEILD